MTGEAVLTAGLLGIPLGWTVGLILGWIARMWRG